MSAAQGTPCLYCKAPCGKVNMVARRYGLLQFSARCQHQDPGSTMGCNHGVLPMAPCEKGQIAKNYISGLFCVEVFEKVNSSKFDHIDGATYLY
jgi:hypothetical protein